MRERMEQQEGRHDVARAEVAVLTGVFSLTIGTIFVLGKTTVLPAIFGG